MIASILLNTPVWVYALVAVLAWLGVCQLRTQSIGIYRVWLTPIVFISWGLLGLIMRNNASVSSLLPWLAAALIGVLVGLARCNTLTIDHDRGRVIRPGSILPLLRNLGVFGVHYLLNIAAALLPDQHGFMQADMVVSGLFAGYFVGWLVRFGHHYFVTANLSASAKLDSAEPAAH